MLRVNLRGEGGKYGKEKKATFNEVNFPSNSICKFRSKIGDKTCNIYLHSALQITKLFHIPHLFELLDNNEAVRTLLSPIYRRRN